MLIDRVLAESARHVPNEPLHETRNEIVKFPRSAATALIFVALVLSVPTHTQAGCSTPAGLAIPCVELEPALKEIFTISQCERISGLTCRITYDGKKPLPREVFFSDLDANGRQLCKTSRLIYPSLKPGESGRVTFLDPCDVSADRLMLRGKWDGR